MKSVFEYTDEHLGRCFIVVPKIREVSKALGNLVITFDNGDKRSIMVDDTNQAIQDILDAINKFYG
ncbi:MAG TPA: hypothetical protein PL188_06500 [Candidatus Cloacimonadota bacterium]|jgi:hypothetical protein|nr:hypothetical protein [Candidatus Cloacimonadota bacterium]